MNISLSYAAGFYRQTFEEFLEAARNLKADGVQLIPDQEPNLYCEFRDERIDHLATLIDTANFNVSVHNIFYDINPSSLIPAVQNLAIDESEKVFRFARKIGSKSITIHPGYIYPGWLSDPQQNKAFWASAAEGLTKICLRANDEGILPLIENGSYHLSSKHSQIRRPFHLGISISELRKILDVIDAEVGICFDVDKARVSDIKIDDFVGEFHREIKQIQFSRVDTLNYIIDCFTRRGQQNKIMSLDCVFEGRDLAEYEKALELRKATIFE